MVVSQSSLLLFGVASLAVVAAASLFIAYNSRTYVRKMASPLEEEQLRAYHEIVSAIIRFNRKAVRLHSDDLFQLHQERYVMDNESELEDEIVDIVEAYHRSFYLISADVRDAVGEYVDYISEYHPHEGAQISEVLKRTGNVVETIRSDLDLESVFTGRQFDDVSPDTVADESDGTEAMPSSSR